MLIEKKNFTPEIIIKTLITWLSSTEDSPIMERFFLDIQEGKLYDTKPEFNLYQYICEIECGTKKIFERKAYSISIDKDTNMLAFSMLRQKYYIPEDNKPYISNWEETDRFYIDKYKNIWKCDDFSKDILEYKNYGQLKRKRDFPITNQSLNVGNNFTALWDFWNFFVTINGNIFITLENLDNILEFLIYKEPQKRKGPKQEMIDILTKKKLPAIRKRELKKPIWSYVAQLDKVEDGICVIRTFTNSIPTNSFAEGIRIYVTKDDFYICKQNLKGDFYPVTTDLYRYHWDFILPKINKDFVKETKLEYTIDCIEELKPEFRLIALTSFLKWEIFEKLYKAGYKNICKCCFNNGYGNSFSELTFMFANEGVLYKKDISISEFTQMNTHQLQKLEKALDTVTPLSYSREFIIKNVKDWLGQDLSHIDDKTFDFAIDILVQAIEGEYDLIFTDIVSNIITIKSFDFIKKNASKLLSFVNVKDCDSYIYLRKYRDYLSMISHPRLRHSGYPVIITNKEELKKMHTNVAAIYNLIKDDYNEESFKILASKWNKYTFNDDNFIITYPKSPIELVEEGKNLHHCVKSYIDKVAREKTIVLFLRKKDEPNKSYFTIELENNKIMQIHGFSNCNLPKSSPEMKFVMKWKEEKHLDAQNFNITR